uniref:Uncharacterized protein n=1 Tax=Romanomermis culicivorax TaxID=13658 RepID=A0A915IJ33_ROMCU
MSAHCVQGCSHDGWQSRGVRAGIKTEDEKQTIVLAKISILYIVPFVEAHDEKCQNQQEGKR